MGNPSILKIARIAAIVILFAIEFQHSIGECQEFPSTNKSLELLDYRPENQVDVVDGDQRPLFRIGRDPSSPLRVVSSTVESQLESERAIFEPSITCEYEFVYGEMRESNSESIKIPIRIHMLVLDDKLNKIRTLDSSTAFEWSPGQPSRMVTTCGLQLESPLQSGVLVCAVLYRPAGESSWRLLSYNMHLIDQIQ